MTYCPPLSHPRRAGWSGSAEVRFDPRMPDHPEIEFIVRFEGNAVVDEATIWRAMRRQGQTHDASGISAPGGFVLPLGRVLDRRSGVTASEPVFGIRISAQNDTSVRR